ncbi:hypothetical protein BC939DRAFT_445464, partial [Gamsiella multidivaricata]|uniref:uncharacterized protein n=1 Tax=Gamsiella multidivaricata TaxID=101098 RepID=UPI00221F0E7F
LSLSLSFSMVLWFFLCALSPVRAVSLARGIFVLLFAFFYVESLLGTGYLTNICGAAFLP